MSTAGGRRDWTEVRREDLAHEPGSWAIISETIALVTEPCLTCPAQSTQGAGRRGSRSTSSSAQICGLCHLGLEAHFSNPLGRPHEGALARALDACGATLPSTLICALGRGRSHAYVVMLLFGSGVAHRLSANLRMDSANSGPFRLIVFRAGAHVG